MSTLPALRLNARAHELIVRRTRARTAVELRRKQDGVLLAHGTGQGRIVLSLHPGARAEARRALASLAPLARHAQLVLSLATATRGSRRAPQPPLPIAALLREIPADYGASRRLARVREPRLLHSVGRDRFGREQFLAPAAARAWLRMQAAARDDGVMLELVSAFRSVAYQAALVASKVAAGRTLAQVLEVNAAPGYSEHHGGDTIDISTPGTRPLEENFESTDAFRWLAARSAALGFSLSYPRGNVHGIGYEPWHWRYVRMP